MKKITSFLARGSAVVVTSALMANQAFAQAAAGNPLTDALDSVDLTGLVVKIGAAGLVIVAVAMAFKGSTLGKRVVSKV